MTYNPQGKRNLNDTNFSSEIIEITRNGTIFFNAEIK